MVRWSTETSTHALLRPQVLVICVDHYSVYTVPVVILPCIDGLHTYDATPEPRVPV